MKINLANQLNRAHWTTELENRTHDDQGKLQINRLTYQINRVQQAALQKIGLLARSTSVSKRVRSVG